MADIFRPSAYITGTETVNAKIVWNNRFIDKMNTAIGKGGKIQELIDNAVVFGVEPYMPRLEGAMFRSGIINTVIGSGLVKWSTPYVRVQWFGVDWRTGKPLTYHGGGVRGSYWAKRWAEDHLAELETNMNEEAGRLI